MIHDKKVGGHPTVKITLDRDRSLRSVERSLAVRGAGWLNDIEWAILSGKRTDVVNEGVTILHDHVLSDTDALDPGTEYGFLLINDGGFVRKRIASFRWVFHVDEDIGKGTRFTDENVFIERRLTLIKFPTGFIERETSRLRSSALESDGAGELSVLCRRFRFRRSGDVNYLGAENAVAKVALKNLHDF